MITRFGFAHHCRGHILFCDVVLKPVVGFITEPNSDEKDGEKHGEHDVDVFDVLHLISHSTLRLSTNTVRIYTPLFSYSC